ncbi:MAG TPA: adenine deaminase [Bacteroidales bacterium]|nr:adenine deaminase [Bacteroidales bacterium]
MEKQEFKGQIVDPIQRRIYPGTITVQNGIIESIREEQNDSSHFILPGLIDAHIHIESSMLTPYEFARIASTHGTVGTISDPHEIANVLGVEGVKWMIENGKLAPFYFHFGAPSCVPATSFETSGAQIGIEELEQLLQMQEINHLGEMMNFPGVIHDDPMVVQKLQLAQKYQKPIDGHAPMVTGEALEKYYAAQITTDHECYTFDEAEEKIKLGMKILIREGSAAKNFDALIPLIEKYPEQLMFCSDDKHPDDLIEGHINLLIARGLKLGYDFFDLLRCATYNPVTHYNLAVGMLQVGDSADFIVVDHWETMKVLETYIRGQKVAKGGMSVLPPLFFNSINKFNIKKIEEEQLRVPTQNKKIKIIELFQDQIFTKTIIDEPLVKNGYVVPDLERDYLKIIVINRYSEQAPAIGFVKNFGLKEGAIASSVAHDSHNIIAVGCDDKSLVRAIQGIIDTQGGILYTNDNELISLPLPIAGLMSDQNADWVSEQYQRLNKAVQKAGSPLTAPFMTLSFMGLLVIPELKMSDMGLFDGINFQLTELFDSSK